jgi:transcriptional regulator with XRE-family HTH domain
MEITDNCQQQISDFRKALTNREIPLDSAVMTTYGENFRRLRERATLSQEDVAARLGFKKGRNSNISTLEQSDHIPKLDTILRHAEALGCEPADLLDDVASKYDYLKRFTTKDRKDVTKVSASTAVERIESEQPNATNEGGPHGRTPILSGGDHSGIYVDQLLRALESVERLSAELTANLNALHDLSETVIDRSAAVSTASPGELATTTRLLTRSARPASAARRKTGGKTPRRAK